MNKKSKRILFIDFCPISGSTQGLLTEVEYLMRFHKDQFDFVIVGYPDSIIKSHSEKFAYPYYESEATEIRYFWGSPLRTLKLFTLTMLKLLHVCLFYRPNIIHCNHYMWSIYANPIGFLFRIPVVIHLKDVWMLEPKVSRILMKFYKNVRYIAVSKYVRRLFVEKYHLSQNKVELIYDGINSDIFYPPDRGFFLRKKSQKIKQIVMMSRIVPERNIEVFIDMAAILLQKYPKLLFVHYGFSKAHSDRKYLEILRKRIRALNIGNYFSFKEYQNNPLEVSRVLRSSYITVAPARQFALPNTAIESIMCGTPCIAANVGGNGEIINSEWRIGVNSPVLYAEKIKEFLQDVRDYSRESTKSAIRVKNKFNSVIQGVQLVKLYNSLLK